jgi:hypothetical protein
VDIEDARKNATVSQLEADIDSGRSGDKRRGFDPAAATGSPDGIAPDAAPEKVVPGAAPWLLLGGLIAVLLAALLWLLLR